MKLEKVVNKKLVTIEVLKGGLEILDKHSFFITSSFSLYDRNYIVYKLKENILNTYLRVSIVENKVKVLESEDLLYTDNLQELLEVLLIQYKEQGEYEICEVLKLHLDNIYS